MRRSATSAVSFGPTVWFLVILRQQVPSGSSPSATTVDHVAFCEDALEPSAGHNQHRADMPGSHLAGRLAHRRRRGQMKQRLIVNDLGDDLAVHVPPRCEHF
jgi:hypothetical protein